MSKKFVIGDRLKDEWISVLDTEKKKLEEKFAKQNLKAQQNLEKANNNVTRAQENLEKARKELDKYN